MKRRALVLSLLALTVMLAACEGETSLEFTPEAVSSGVCPQPHQEPGDPPLSGEWGTVTPISNGVEYEINEGYTVTICAKGGPGYSILTVEGPT